MWASKFDKNHVKDVWWMFDGYFVPTTYVGSLLKSKRRGQKNIQKKAIQTKINLYNKYIKWNITNIRIYPIKYSSACVYVTNTNIMVKD